MLLFSGTPTGRELSIALNETAYYVHPDRLCDLSAEEYRQKIIISGQMSAALPCHLKQLMASLDKANVVAHIWLVAPFKTSPPHELFTQVSWTRNQWRRDGKFQIIGVNLGRE